MVMKRCISTIFFSLLMLVYALPLAAQTDVFQIAYGVTVSDGVPGTGAGNIETGGAQDAYEFEGISGEDVIFDSLVGSSGQFWWLLTAPDGSVLIDSFNLDRRIVLPQTGTYTLTVRGSNATTTGVYSLRLLLVPSPQEFAISVGDTVSENVPAAGAGNLETPGATDVYTFDAAIGDEVIFNWLSGSNVLIGWRLDAPDGTVLFDVFLQDRQVMLSQTGTYRLTVRGNGVDDTGVYSFQLLGVASSADQFNISIGDTVSDGVPAAGAGNLEAPGATDVYMFDAATGDEVIFDWLAGSNVLIGWRLEAPDGTVLFDGPLADQQVVLPQTGTYTFTVRGNGVDDTGVYSFQLISAGSSADQFNISVGDTVSDGMPAAGAGNLEAPGATDVYTFDGQAGAGVLFDWLAGNNVFLGWRLDAPDGTVLFDGPLADHQVVLPQTGTYKLTVRGNGVDDFGVYSFALMEDDLNSSPIATDDEATTDEDVSVSIDVLANDTDVDGDPLNVESVTQPSNGVVANNGTDVTYIPNANFNGTDSFTYTVSDGNGGNATAAVTITVNPVNDNPVAIDDEATTDEDVSVTIDVLANDTDVDGDPLIVESVTQPPNGVVANNGTDVTYTPSANFNGTDSFTYTVSDGNAGNATAAVTITVNPVNDNPVAQDDAAATTQDTPVTVDILANDSDVDGDLLVIDGLSQPGSGSAAINPDNTVTYTPNPGFSGADNLTYTISDGRGGLATAVIIITVSDSAVQEVRIDILPFIWLNIVNLNSRGTLPVAILSDAGFDARFVNVDSVSLAGAPAVRPFPHWPKHLELDVNHDRRKDIIIYFNIQDFELDLSATEAVLSGETYSGLSFAGADRIIIVPPLGPSLFNPQDGQVLQTNWPHFRWLPLAIDTCYQFQLHDAPFTANEQPVLQEATVVIMAHYQPGFLTNGTYYWRVRVGGSCQIQPGPWSSVRSFTVQAR